MELLLSVRLTCFFFGLPFVINNSVYRVLLSQFTAFAGGVFHMGKLGFPRMRVRVQVLSPSPVYWFLFLSL